jgi:hypothetical protein
VERTLLSMYILIKEFSSASRISNLNCTRGRCVLEAFFWLGQVNSTSIG